MSERTFRAVVAAVLVGALALAVLVVAVLLPGPATPSPRPSTSARPPSASAPAPTATGSPGPALAVPNVVGVGRIARGASSAQRLAFRFLEAKRDSIPNAPGSFVVTLADQAGDGSTVLFYGTPAIIAPGSLGATAALVAPNVLMVKIVAADTYNVELISISGLGIRTTPAAAVGPIAATLGDFTGSLAGGAVTVNLDSPGTIVTGQ